MRNARSTRTYRTPAILALLAIAAILAFATIMTVSAQSQGPDWKQPPTGLSVTAGAQPGEIDIVWDPHPQSSKTLFDYRVTWTQDGAAFQPQNRPRWNAYPTTNEITIDTNQPGAIHQVKVRARYDDGKTSNWSAVISGQATATPNSPATGQPAITGTAEIEETLTATTSGITDGNGLTNTAFNHQWVRSANGADSDVTDATGPTYVVTADDVDSTLKVRVSFTDDDGYSETLTSNATASVPEPPIIEGTPVLDSWSLIPAGLTTGDQFRLIFLSSTTRNANSSNIAHYNTFIQDRAAAGHDDIQAHSDGFTVVGCTAAVDARENTDTTGLGVPIYWLGGNKVADGYTDFYDGNWHDEVNDKDESGANGPDTSQFTNQPFTGCDDDGTQAFNSHLSAALGNPTGYVHTGSPDGNNSNTGPISGFLNPSSTNTRPYYGLSAVFTVAGAPEVTVEVDHDWSLIPSGMNAGDKFRLIFLSSNKRDATDTAIDVYNTWIQTQVAAGHAAVQAYSDGFTVVGCTEDDDARDNTGTTYTRANRGVPIHWLNGTKVADNYQDFYDGSWDDEVNDKNQHGNDGPDTSQETNYPWTGREHDGTEAFVGADSESLGNTVETRGGRPNSSASGVGPINGAWAGDPLPNHPMYGLSQVLEAQPFPSNTGTLTTGGKPRTGSINGSDTGEYWQVELAKGIPYQIDVKGSERSQPGGTIDNPRIKLLAGSNQIKLVNRRATGVSQTTSETRATGGGAGANSRLDIKAKETDNYRLLIHRAAGDNGTYTVTVTNLGWPDGRRAPDITVGQENRNNVEISWTKSKKTHSSLVAPPGNYKIEYRTLSGGSWSNAGTVDESARDATITGLSRNTAYEIRVRMIPPADSTHIYRWGYARVYTTN